uniref:Interferon-induced protein 44-like n=1 Tax=Scophthalmus maximus TaxID=52904 RepID=A0A8D3AZJ6_SCOMX
MSDFTAMGGGHSTEPEPEPVLLPVPWRTLPENNLDNLEFVKSYKPHNKEGTQLRILLHGPNHAGKSSFINSVESVLQGRVTDRAATDAISGMSFTKNYKTHKIQKDPEQYYSFVFNDVMGLEDNTDCGVCEEDLNLALRGHVKEYYKFNPHSHLTENDQEYNSSPTLADKVHILVSVVSADSLTLLKKDVVRKMRNIRLAASEMGIPQLAIITKVDEACPEAAKNMNNIYKSKLLKEKVDKLHNLLGLSRNRIFLVKNYNSELETNDAIDAPILLALKQMLHSGEDFLNNL